MNKTALVGMAMVVGSVMAMGCKAKHNESDSAALGTGPDVEHAIAPEENPETAPVQETGTSGVEKDERHFHYYAPHAPPTARTVVIGRPSTERDFWVPGYYRWNGREHVWYDGRWEHRRPGYEYVGPRWVTVGPRYEYIPGHWVRRS